MAPMWRLRQFSCIDQAGRVVDIRPKKGIGDRRVVAWRIRWDAPGHPDRSQTFSKSRHDTPTAAYEAAARLADQLQSAAQHDPVPDERGRPKSPVATAEPAEAQTAAMTLRELGEAWIAACGGAGKTTQQHERSLNFALRHLPEGILADDVTSEQAQELLLARRYTPGQRARKLVRMGSLDPDDAEARMCAVQTERVFLQDLRKIFEFGAQMKPPVIDGDPTQGLRARRSSEQAPDPSLEVTFPPQDILGIASLIEDPVFQTLVILRGFTAIRSGEFTRTTIDDIDRDRCEFVLRGTGGEVPKRLNSQHLSWENRPLKNRNSQEARYVPYPDTDLFNRLIDELIEEARLRHARRDKSLNRLLLRYRAESAKSHLIDTVARELREHRRHAPLLITMPNGSPFRISRFDRSVWKPALRQYYPIEDPNDEAYNPLRETRFYNLRAAAVEFLIEDGGMEESEVAAIAGHSIETQRSSYRRPRGSVRRGRIDEAARLLEE